MPRKQTQQEFIKKSKSIFGNKLNYKKVKYLDSKTNIILICKKHGDFLIAPKDHISYKRGCKICKGIRFNTDTFVKKAKFIHNNKYIYDNVNFINAKVPIIIICKTHGKFEQTPDKHINKKQGCPKCKKTARRDLSYFIIKGNEIHNNFYDYSLVIFTKMFDPVVVKCPIHGRFNILPSNHINNKQGCGKCARLNTRLTLTQFIKKSNKVHNNRFIYTNTNYVNMVNKIEIVCKIHGSFWQIASGHINGNGCPKCVGHISKKEIQWLNILKVPKKYRNKTLHNGKRYYCVDAYDSTTNTIYEFYGDYWHGNPRRYSHKQKNKNNKISFKKLYDKTIKREKELKKLGYNIISIWEMDYQLQTKMDRQKR